MKKFVAINYIQCDPNYADRLEDILLAIGKGETVHDFFIQNLPSYRELKQKKPTVKLAFLLLDSISYSNTLVSFG